MGYYVTMEGASFKSLLSPDEMIEAIKMENIPHLCYGEGSGADFDIQKCWSPGNEQHHVYEIIPFNEDYYFKYHSEVIDSMVDFLKTVIAPGTYTHLMFHGEDADMWGYLIRNDCVNDISYKLVVKTDTGEVDMEEFIGDTDQSGQKEKDNMKDAQAKELLRRALYLFNMIPNQRYIYEGAATSTYDLAAEIGRYVNSEKALQ